MTDFLSPAEPTTAPELIELIYDRGLGEGQLLRPTEAGAAYYSLALVEYLEAGEPSLDDSVTREWRRLGAVYLLAGTLQTLRWGTEPGTYHVGRVPQADRYRLVGEDHEYTLAELVDTLARGPVAFRGYPVPGNGPEPHLQLTPAREGEEGSESAYWVTTQRRLLAGPATQRDGAHYQLYEEVDAEGLSTGTCFIGQREPAGERLTPHSAAELAAVDGDWLNLLPK